MKILDGKKVSKDIREKIKTEIKSMGYKPKMVDIQIGDNPASDIYIKGKEKASKEIGIDFECIRYKDNIKEEEIIKKIKELNNDKKINGIFIQSPIPEKYDEIKIMNTVIPEKDVDGLTYLNAGMLLNNKESLIPCTPNGIMHILNFYKINIVGKKVVIIGRSNLVGKPLMNILINNNATVTLCHSKTKDIEKITKKADILIVAIGKKNFIKKDMIKNKCVIIDVGINRGNGKIYGDVDFESVKDKVNAITPVPGGVGPMTVTMLLYNTLKAYKIQNKKV